MLGPKNFYRIYESKNLDICLADTGTTCTLRLKHKDEEGNEVNIIECRVEDKHLFRACDSMMVTRRHLMEEQQGGRGAIQQ